MKVTFHYHYFLKYLFPYTYLYLNITEVSGTRRRRSVERYPKESAPPSRRAKRKEVSKSPITRGKKRVLEEASEQVSKKAKYYHESDSTDILSDVNRDPTKSAQKTIAEVFSPSVTGKDTTDSLLCQILARLELLRKQHEQTERQIQYIIDESKSNPDMFIIQQAKLSQTEMQNNVTMSGELMVNLHAISDLLKRD